MCRNLFVICCLSILIASPGCRGNRCANPYGSGWFAGSQTIAPPPTYSLNIPSANGQQPYYVPGQSGNPRTALLNTNNAAPTPAGNSTSNQANLNGWRPVQDNGNANGNTSATSGQNASTIFAQNGAASQTGYRTASNTALPGSGHSYTNSPNYQSTRGNESQDPTRLPVTDATTVRAPASYSQIPQQPNRFNPPTYLANPMLAGNPYPAANPVYMGQPMVNGPYAANPYINPTMAVQSQSTTTLDTSTQVGWRDRELGSDSFSR